MICGYIKYVGKNYINIKIIKFYMFIIKKTCISKIPINCTEYGKIRLSLSKDKQYISIDPCCYWNFCGGKPLSKIQFDEIDKLDCFQKIIDCYNSFVNPKIIFKACLVENENINTYKLNNIIQNDEYKNYYCNYGKRPIENIEVSIQTSCNLNCIMCREQIIINKEIDKLYFKILEQLKGHNLNCLQLTAQGEPFLYKTETFNYLNSLNRNDFKNIICVSNLTLLNDNDIDNLYRINNNIKIRITASIDAITESTYKKIRKNNFFTKVMHNACYLNELGLLTGINFVLQKENLNELMQAYEYWHNIIKTNFNVIPICNSVDMINNDIYKNYLKISSI